MRILLAGGSGVLGRAVLPLLVAAGHEVVATTRTPSKTALLAQQGARPVVVDALDRASVLASVAQARPDVVVHLLTDLGTGTSASNAELRRTGTRNLVDAARRSGVDRMVAESISWVHRPGPAPAGEDDPLDLDATGPRRTTVTAVAALETAVQELPAGVVLRFGLLYGPGTWYSRTGRYGVEVREGRLPATETVTSFVHVADAARAVLLALGWPAGVWHVVDDEPAAGREWVPVLAAALGAPRPADATVGDIGRPVSNARATSSGLPREHPSWRTGFLTL